MTGDERLDEICAQLARTIEGAWGEGDNREEWAPIVHFFPATAEDRGEVMLLANLDIATDGGVAVLKHLTHGHSLETNAYAVALLAEAWMKTGESAERAARGEEPTPRGDPQGSQEILMVIVDAKSGRRGLEWPIVREADGSRRLGERNAWRTGLVTGRLADLLHPGLKLN